MLRTQMFSCLFAHATFVADTKFVSEWKQKICFSFPLVFSPKKHHKQQCVFVFHRLTGQISLLSFPGDFREIERKKTKKTEPLANTTKTVKYSR